MPSFTENKPDPSSFGSSLDWAGHSKPGQRSCAARGKRKKGQLNHKPNSLAGQMDSKSKHTAVKRCWETLTEALGIKRAHQLYGIYRPASLCLTVPWLSPVGWSLSASNTASVLNPCTWGQTRSWSHWNHISLSNTLPFLPSPPLFTFCFHTPVSAVLSPLYRSDCSSCSLPSLLPAVCRASAQEQPDFNQDYAGKAFLLRESF